MADGSGNVNVCVASSVVMALLVLAGCGTYHRPSDQDIRAAASAIRPASRADALGQLHQVFQGIRHVGRLIFDECRINAINDGSFDVACTSYKGDSSSPGFRLMVEGMYSVQVPFCEPRFESVPQVPLMVNNFFVNGFNFEGNQQRALKAYGLLSYLCDQGASAASAIAPPAATPTPIPSASPARELLQGVLNRGFGDVRWGITFDQFIRRYPNAWREAETADTWGTGEGPQTFLGLPVTPIYQFDQHNPGYRLCLILIYLRKEDVGTALDRLERDLGRSAEGRPIWLIPPGDVKLMLSGQMYTIWLSNVKLCPEQR